MPSWSERRTQERYDKLAQRVNVPFTVLSFSWLVVLAIPLAFALPGLVRHLFTAADVVIWLVFVSEYATKLFVSPRRTTFVRTHLLNLLVIALPILRPFGFVAVLSLVRIGAILIYSLTRAHKVFSHRGLHFVLLSSGGILLIGAALELALEKHAPGSNIHNYGSALWWAVVTVTTVGYGDKYPVTTGGRAVAVVLMLVGISLIGVVTATVASYFVEENADQSKAELHKRLDKIEALLEDLVAQPQHK